ncbi:hypothetical protein TRFO_03342 [Tritrichomonas foetus]|uniref:Bromo domain-containing protein n=1 Tax=Tritrichomonas foetus TaxID=1144522 RepID=A0A1J4KV11_9EUKA|nr:hypothetical protein TRFO_03342 [Tritrichomonas foetus]|eukprot:OHT13580.1 hypothetical protein TRFO_03342 [Tritrichomonas foetus]
MFNIPFTQDSAEHAIQIMERLAQRPCAKPFLLPVDPVRDMVPNYYQVITNPIDISLVIEKLLLNKYALVDDWIKDIHLIRDNAKLFNGTNSFIYQLAICFVKHFEQELNSFYRYNSLLWTQVYTSISSKLSSQMERLPLSDPPNALSEYSASHTTFSEPLSANPQSSLPSNSTSNNPISYISSNFSDDMSDNHIHRNSSITSHTTGTIAQQKFAHTNEGNFRNIKNNNYISSAVPLNEQKMREERPNKPSRKLPKHPVNQTTSQPNSSFGTSQSQQQQPETKKPKSLFGDIDIPLLPPTLPPAHSSKESIFQTSSSFNPASLPRTLPPTLPPTLPQALPPTLPPTLPPANQPNGISSLSTSSIAASLPRTLPPALPPINQQQIPPTVQTQSNVHQNGQQGQNVRYKVNIFGDLNPLPFPGSLTISPPEIGPIGEKGKNAFDLHLSDAKGSPPFRFSNSNLKADIQTEQKKHIIMSYLPKLHTTKMDILQMQKIISCMEKIDPSKIACEIDLGVLQPQTLDELINFLNMKVKDMGVPNLSGFYVNA